MPRQNTIPTANRAPGVYGPFEIDGVAGDVGVQFDVTRGNTGTWPLTNADFVMALTFEGMWNGQWAPLASTKLVGGQRIDRWTGQVALVDTVRVWWPKERSGEVLVPVVPDAVRVTVEIYEQLRAGATLTWLS